MVATILVLELVAVIITTAGCLKLKTSMPGGKLERTDPAELVVQRTAMS